MKCLILLSLKELNPVEFKYLDAKEKLLSLESIEVLSETQMRSTSEKE